MCLKPPASLGCWNPPTFHSKQSLQILLLPGVGCCKTPQEGSQLQCCSPTLLLTSSLLAEAVFESRSLEHLEELGALQHPTLSTASNPSRATASPNSPMPLPEEGPN